LKKAASDIANPKSKAKSEMHTMKKTGVKRTDEQLAEKTNNTGFVFVTNFSISVFKNLNIFLTQNLATV